MNWLTKLENKMGGRAVPYITRIFIVANIIGNVLYNVHGTTALSYLQFSPAYILKGQIWRIITWIFVPTGGMSFLMILFLICLWMLGDSLETYLGSFKMNVYFFGAIILYIVAGFIVYFVTGFTINLTMYYILISMYLMLGLFMPEAEVRLYFVLPIKMKWMVIVYFITFAYDIYQFFNINVLVGILYGTEIVLALVNLLFFVYSCKNRMSFKQNVKQKKRQNAYRSAFSQPRPGSGITQHKCCICGRTEISNPELSFRYCSKCVGNREYCSDHLFTHNHVI